MNAKNPITLAVGDYFIARSQFRGDTVYKITEEDGLQFCCIIKSKGVRITKTKIDKSILLDAAIQDRFKIRKITERDAFLELL